jgi:hypothetical protein
VIVNNDYGSFYRFVSRKFTCKNGIGALRNDRDEIVTGELERAMLLNEYFSSMCSVDGRNNLRIDRAVPNDTILNEVSFTP